MPEPAPTVLIADDEPEIRTLLKAVLTPLRCRLLEAATGTDAWYAIRLERPAVAIIDLTLGLSLGGVDGLQLVRLVRRTAALDATRLVILTGHASAQLEKEARAAGADHYLTKPIRPTVLRDVVGALLDNRPPAPSAGDAGTRDAAA